MDADGWEELYRSRDQVFSGRPNGPLVAEASDLPPGRALDVGCGEGGDALWLARRGWEVTGVDISATALQRAAAAGPDVADRVTWSRADLSVTPPPAGAFDLVSAHYVPVLRTTPDHRTLRGLIDAVAPGGTLLFVNHDIADLPPHHGDSIDPSTYYQPSEVARLLDPDWTVLVDETRPRTAAAPPGTHHVNDTVLRARRPG